MLIVVFGLGVLSAPQAFCIDAVKIRRDNAVRTQNDPWAFCADRSNAVTFTADATFLARDGDLDADAPFVNVTWTVKLTGGSGRLRYDRDGDSAEEYYDTEFTTKPAKQGSVVFDIVPPKGEQAYNPAENTLEVTVTNCEDSEDEGSDTDQVHFIRIDLEQVDDNSPISPKNRMCSNAQDKYKNVKYKVHVTPCDKNVDLTISGDADVTFRIGGTQVMVGDGTTIILQADNGTYGSWRLTTAIQSRKCESNVAGHVFKFEFISQFDKADSTDGGTQGGYAVDMKNRKVSTTAYGTPDPAKLYTPVTIPKIKRAKSQHGKANLAYDVKVISKPSGMYSGDIKGRFRATADTRFECKFREDFQADGHGVRLTANLPIIPNFLTINKTFGDKGQNSEGGAFGAGTILLGQNPPSETDVDLMLLDASFTSNDVHLSWLGPRVKDVSTSKTNSDITHSPKLTFTVGKWNYEAVVGLGVIARVEDKSEVCDGGYNVHARRCNVSEITSLSYQISSFAIQAATVRRYLPAFEIPSSQ